MKINCECGCQILDIADNQSTKALYIPDKAWNGFWDAIDDAIEKSGPTPEDKEKAVMSVRQMSLFRTMWQCPECGQLFIDDQDCKVHTFKPISEPINKAIPKRKPTSAIFEWAFSTTDS